jgi:hypothetical protein
MQKKPKAPRKKGGTVRKPAPKRPPSDPNKAAHALVEMLAAKY